MRGAGRLSWSWRALLTRSSLRPPFPARGWRLRAPGAVPGGPERSKAGPGSVTRAPELWLAGGVCGAQCLPWGPQAQAMPLLWAGHWPRHGDVFWQLCDRVHGLDSHSFPQRECVSARWSLQQAGVVGEEQVLPPDTSHSGFLADLVRVLVFISFNLPDGEVGDINSNNEYMLGRPYSKWLDFI